MNDLISRQWVLDALGVFSDRVNGNEHFLNGIETAREIVENAEAVEAMPVRHGSWRRYGYGNTFDCSVCGFTFTINDYKESKSVLNYCPRCGARMMNEEEQEDED